MPEKKILPMAAITVSTGNCFVLVQDGKILQDGDLRSDNIQVHPIYIPGLTVVIDSQAILRELKAKYPKCAFTWFADPISVPLTEPASPPETPAAPPVADPPPAGGSSPAAAPDNEPPPAAGEPSAGDPPALGNPPAGDPPAAGNPPAGDRPVGKKPKLK